jgi:hypothetical protein
MLLRFGCTGCLAVFFASLVQRRPIAAVSRARLAGRFDVVDGFRELLACLSRAILPEAENRKRALDAAKVAGLEWTGLRRSGSPPLFTCATTGCIRIAGIAAHFEPGSNTLPGDRQMRQSRKSELIRCKLVKATRWVPPLVENRWRCICPSVLLADELVKCLG